MLPLPVAAIDELRAAVEYFALVIVDAVAFDHAYGADPIVELFLKTASAVPVAMLD